MSNTPKATMWQPGADHAGIPTLAQAGDMVAAVKAEAASVRAGKGSPSAWEQKATRADKAQKATWAAMKAMTDHAENEERDFLASERRTYREYETVLETLAQLDRIPDRPEFDSRDDAENYAPGRPLASGQSFAAYTRARASERGEDYDGELSLDKYMRGVLTGNWRDARREQEIMNAMSGASSAAGGVLIPTILSGQIIDLARAQTRVLEAGAQIVPMESRTVDVARWTQDPNLTWRTENAVVSESDAAVDKITLSAKTLATVVRVSRELVEDTSIGYALANAFAAALAQKVDQAALYGDGTGGAPTGVKATGTVTKTSMGANGASLTSWDPLIDAKGRLRDANEAPGAQIMADRTARALAKLKAAGSGEYLAPPEYLADVARLTTSGVPVALTVGSSSDCSDVFTGDWSQLWIGLRTDLQITILSERYMTNDAAGSPAGGQYGFMAWWRGDIAIARPKAFDVLTGVRG